jgi:hypothetical protein
VERQHGLLDVISALSPPGRFARLLDGWQQQRNQDCDDRYHNEQFDQGETSLTASNRARRNNR